jgi:hypothetical protein
MSRNLAFENSTPGSSRIQALALRCDADRTIFDNARFLGYQDTLFVWSSTRQYFRKSFITGDTDFIFGNATAVFDRCTIESTGPGYITAADTRRTTANGLIFLDCLLTNGAARAPNNSVFLGRPWFYLPQEQMPSVIFIRTRTGPHITGAGWDPWDFLLNPSVNRDPYTRFSEWGSMNATGDPLPDSNLDGTPNGRVQWADLMTAEQAANYTLRIFWTVDFWNADTQPEASTHLRKGRSRNPDIRCCRCLPFGAKPCSHLTRLSLATGAVGIGRFHYYRDRAESDRSGDRSIVKRFRVDDALADPTLEIHGGPGNSLIAMNDNWRYDPASVAELEAVGLEPTSWREAAKVATLPPGTYTAVVAGKNGSGGTAVVEVYDGDLTADSQLANISTRGFVGAEDDVLIGGFVVGNGLVEVVVRALGPSLMQFDVADPIADPTLELHDGNGNVMSNDDWQTGADHDSIPASAALIRAVCVPPVCRPATPPLSAEKRATGVALVEAQPAITNWESLCA